MNNIALKTNTVCKGFGEGETRTEVLKEVNFEARMGELLMLVGPSGCGKTTLLSVIAGTLGVDRDEVEVFDSPLHSLDKRAVTQFVIIVTHDNRVFKYADRMTFMEDGRIDRTETKQPSAIQRN